MFYFVPMSKTKVLVLDDSIDLLEVFDAIFTFHGFDVTAVKNKKELLAALSVSIPHVILIDIFMPDFDGREICQQLKNSSEYKHIPTILMSGSHNDLESYKDCLADDVIEKPFTIETVIDKVKSLVAIEK